MTDRAISRRAFATTAATAALASPLLAQLGFRSQNLICASKDAGVIDLHCHIFNALDLPIESIFVYWCRLSNVIPDEYGRAAAAIINAIALAKGGGPGSVEADFDEVLSRVTGAADAELSFWSGLFAQLAPPEVARDARVTAAVQKSTEVNYPHFIELEDLESIRAGFRAIFSRLLKALPEEIFADDVADLALRARSKISAGGKWLWLMTEPEWRIASYLCRRVSDVGLFVNHLMDMTHYYPGPQLNPAEELEPVIPVALQPARMRSITQMSTGRFVPFAAFDPQRGVMAIRAALASGALGVKVYPPNGYHPEADKASWKALFNYCRNKKIPVLAHCTKGGFQADIASHSGCNSSPKYWEPIVAEWRDVKICLGHAGGGGPWFGDFSKDCNEQSFTTQALELMQKYDNVYLEVAYLDQIMKTGSVEHFRDAIVAAAKQYPNLPKRLCYGTDWHMPGMFAAGADAYLRKFQEAFTNIEWKDAFFRTNAMDFLNIQGYIDRNRGQSWFTAAIETYLKKFA